MTNTNDWSAYQHWHELLDTLCTQNGYLDNLALADALCAASGNSTQSSFDTAVKNLRNWRHGIHIPQRKNFILLGKILKIDRDGELKRQWNFLYSEAKLKPSTETTPPSEKYTETQLQKRKMPNRIILTAAIAAAITAVVVVFSLFPAEPELETDPVASYEGIVAEYVRNVSVKVGDSTIIHGARGNECGEAPTWESAKLLLPELITGILSDGGVGTRHSRQCGGRIPARAIMFTATTPGTEQISLYGDDIVIRVSE